MLGAIFDRPHGVGIGRISGVARDEKLTKDDATEHELGWHAAIRTGQDRGPGRLPLGNFGPYRGQIHLAQLRRREELLVSSLQPGQSVVR